MDKELSSDAKRYLSTLNENSIIDPDDYTFFLFGGTRSNPQLTRSLVREPLVEVNNYNPNFLSIHIKRDFNLLEILDKEELKPTEQEILRLKTKLDNLYQMYWPNGGTEDIDYPPQYGVKNDVISAWMIEKQDIFDYLNGEAVENIYYRVVERRRKIDKP